MLAIPCHPEAYAEGSLHHLEGRLDDLLDFGVGIGFKDGLDGFIDGRFGKTEHDKSPGSLFHDLAFSSSAEQF